MAHVFEEDILASEMQFRQVSEHSVYMSAVKRDTAGVGTGANDVCFFLGNVHINVKTQVKGTRGWGEGRGSIHLSPERPIIIHSKRREGHV